MIVTLAVATAVGVVAGVGLCGLFLRSVLRERENPAVDVDVDEESAEPSRIVRDLFREVIVVTLKTGETFRGVLVAADAHALLFREAAQLAARDAVGIDGELIVPRADIAYLQRP